jgi:hypothetical protein
VPQDHKEANRWFRQAASAGDNDSMNQLGTFPFHSLYHLLCFLLNAVFHGTDTGISYRDGRGCVADAKEAAEWFGKAGERNHADACNSLGSALYSGRGIPRG